MSAVVPESAQRDRAGFGAAGVEADGTAPFRPEGAGARHVVTASWPVTTVLTVVAIALYRVLLVPLAPDNPADRLVILAFIAAFALSELAVAQLSVRGHVVDLSVSEIPFAVGLSFLSPSELVLALAIGAGLAMLAYRAIRARDAVLGVAVIVISGSIGIAVASAVMPASPRDLGTWTAECILAVSVFVMVDLALKVALLAMDGRPPSHLVLETSIRLVQGLACVAVAVIAVVLMHLAPEELWLLVVPAVVGIAAYRSFRAQRERQARLAYLYERSQRLWPAVSHEANSRLAAHAPEAARADVDHRAQVASSAVARGGPADPATTTTRIARAVRALRPEPRADERRLVEALASRIDLVVENAALTEQLASSIADVTKLAAIVQSSEDAIVAIATDESITASNAAAGRLFDSPPGEMLGRPVWDAVPETVRAALRAPFAEVLAGSPAHQVAVDWTHRDGTATPVTIAISPIRDPDGDVTGVSAIVRDESERARADAAVRMSTEQLRAIVSGSPIGMGVIGEDLRWSQANPALCAVLGATMDDMLGRSVAEWIHPDDTSTMASLEHLMFSSDDVVRTVERRYVCPDGTITWASVTARRLAGPTPDAPLALVMVEDITRRRIAEEGHRTTEEQFRRGVLTMSTLEDPALILRAVLRSARELVDATYAAVVTYAADGAQITSYEVDGFRVDTIAADVGRPPGAVGVLAFGPGLEMAVRMRDVRTHPDFVGFPPGHPQLSSFMAVPIPFDTEAPVLLYLANKASADEFTEADEAIAVALATHAGVCLANARITVRSRVLVRDLDRANLDLVNANDAKSRFMATLAHELRTPLHAIMVAGEMVRDSPLGPLTTEQVRSLGGTVESSGRLMVRLIDDLVDLARIESGRLELRPAIFALEDVLAAIRPELARQASERHITLDMPEQTSVRMYADPIRLQQILGNLVGNALKFTRPGGLIRVEAGVTRSTTRIIVSDTGIGIAAEDLDRAFLPFHQVSGTATAGAGLGLAIARSLAELHDGQLVATSTPGSGSIFTLTLPGRRRRRVADRPEVRTPATVAAAAGGERLILIVEDDPTALSLSTMVLRMADYDVWPATSLAEARARLDEAVPALVLLDVRLGAGDGDGLALVREIRASSRLRDVPVLVLSADAMPDDRRRALAAGCDDFLAKPAGPGEVVSRVNALATPAPQATPATHAMPVPPR